MSIRDTEKAKTAKKIIAAMERIKSGTPNHRELKKRTNLKLNQSTVEKESGLSTGALRHHREILAEIIEYNAPEINVASDCLGVNSVIAKSDNEKLQTQKKKAIKAKHDAQERNKELKDCVNRLDRENKALHKHHAQVICALFDLIPQEERIGLFEKDLSLGEGNVVPIR